VPTREDHIRAGKAAEGEEPCPVCHDPVPKTEIPDHIADEHS